jgi:hypothetical protein
MIDPLRLARPALVLACLALAGCASSTSGFEDEGGEDKTVEQGLIKNLMTSMGAIEARERPIEYKPRSPLVVPPKRDLPPPQDPGALTAGNFPKNPEDVDEARLRGAGKDRGAGGRIMTPDEIAEYKMKMPAAPRRVEADSSRRLTPEEMRGQGKITEEALALAANPGPRRSLTEPPIAYKTPSSKAPMEAPEEKSSWKPSWWPL